MRTHAARGNRRPNRSPFVSALLAGVTVAACSQQKASRAVAPDSLRLSQTVELQQTDSSFVAHPYRMDIRRDRSVMISDIGQARLSWFGPDGALRRVIGRRGDGPGEFINPGAIVELDDSTIAVHEYHKQLLKVLRLPDGGELRTVRFDAVVPFGGVVWQDTAWFGAIVIKRGTFAGSIAGVGSLVRWPTNDSVASVQWAAPDGWSQGTLATPLGGLASQMISVDSAGFWVKYGLRDVLERRARDGTLLGEWQIPVQRRRGVPQARIDFALDRDNWAKPEFANPDWTELNFSGDRGLGQRSDGTLLLITMDGAIDGKVLLGHFYVSLLDPLHDRACVDWVLPTRSVAMPLTAVVGDRVALLTQEIDSAATSRVRLMLRYFTLPGEACHWQPMPKARSR